jgi:hypothetical protein
MLDWLRPQVKHGPVFVQSLNDVNCLELLLGDTAFGNLEQILRRALTITSRPLHARFRE